MYNATLPAHYKCQTQTSSLYILCVLQGSWEDEVAIFSVCQKSHVLGTHWRQGELNQKFTLCIWLTLPDMTFAQQKIKWALVEENNSH